MTWIEQINKVNHDFIYAWFTEKSKQMQITPIKTKNWISFVYIRPSWKANNTRLNPSNRINWFYLLKAVMPI